jgi:beta-glucosidase
VRFGWVLPSEQGSQVGCPADAIAVARDADAVVFVGGLSHLFDREGGDRTDLRLPCGQDALIEQIVEANPNTAVVLYGGAAVEMPWADSVKAILYAWYPGMEGGRAVADVLFGDVNPSGKLPVTFPRSLTDCAAHSVGEYAADTCRYTEGIFVGYRHHDAHDIEPLFPFGHGLSYTHFEYSDLRITASAGDDRSSPPALAVSCTIRNAGSTAGKEVAQLYVGKADSAVPRPPRELKGFSKLALEPGEQARVSFEITERDLSYYDVERKEWVCEPGEYRVHIGSSSRDLRLEGPARL